MWILTLLALCALLCCSQGHKHEECLKQPISRFIIKQMINTSALIQESLDKDNTPFHRILGKLGKRSCYKKLNLADLKRILEIYDEHVFQKLWKNSTDPTTELFIQYFRRLNWVIESCASIGKQSHCAREHLKTIEDSFKMPEPGLLKKAMREFRNVLLWISLSMDRKGRFNKNQSRNTD